MKTSLALLVLASAGSVAIVACGGTHRRNNDWRAPPPAAASCASEADCSGAPCAIEMGATKGTCQPIELINPGHGADGGARPPPPLIQPSPSDIQI